jgi:hypothetical protein
MGLGCCFERFIIPFGCMRMDMLCTKVRANRIHTYLYIYTHIQYEEWFLFSCERCLVVGSWVVEGLIAVQNRQGVLRQELHSVYGLGFRV